MLRLLLTIGIILYIDLFLCVFFKKEFGRVLPFVYIILTLIMGISTLLGKLSYFNYVLLGFLIISLVMMIVKVINDKDINEILKRFIKPSLIVFVVFFIYLWKVLSNVELSNIDDLNFWGEKLQDMFRLDALYTSEGYAVIGNTAYPPFPFLLESAFIKLFGVFDETYSLLALSSFSLSYFMFIFDEIKFDKKGLLKTILSFIIIICITLMVQMSHTMAYESYIYNSLYVDWILSIALARSFIDMYHMDTNDLYSYLDIGLCCLTLVMFKQIGLALMLLVVVSLYVYIAISKKKVFIGKKEFIYYLLFVIGMPMIIYGIWKLHLEHFIGSYSASGQIVSGVTNIVSDSTQAGSSGEYYSSLISRFISNCIKEPVMSHPFNISYITIVLIVTAGLVIFGLIKKENKEYYVLPTFYILGSIGYAFGMLLSYMYLFGYEGATLVMFSRYMQTYTYAGLIILIVLLLIKLDKYYQMCVLFVISCLLVEPTSIKTIVYDEERENYRDNIVPYISNYLEYEYDTSNKMLVINQTDIKYRALFKYIAQEKNEYITYAQVTDDMTYETFKVLLDNNDLVYIGDYDDKFLTIFRKVSDITPYNSSLYKIVKEDGNYSFELIYTWENVE